MKECKNPEPVVRESSSLWVRRVASYAKRASNVEKGMGESLALPRPNLLLVFETAIPY